MTVREAGAPPLVETKLSPPRLRHEHIYRRSLVALLDDLTTRKLTVVAAPTGYGKTTVLTRWAGTTDLTVAWATLDRTDNDPARYLSCVITAFARVAPEVGAGALRALRAGAEPIGSAVPLLLNEIGRRDEAVVLVLDDYHTLEATSCHEVTVSILEGAPTQLRVVLSTRQDPPLPVGRLRASGDLGELRANRLRFSPAEAAQLLNGSLELDLDPDSVQRLEQRTEGWPAGLYLAGLSLQGREEPRAFVNDFAGSNRHVVEYLGTEVLAAHPDGLRSFLIRTSILRKLNGPLCDATLDESGSAQRLAELGRSNLFLVPLDEEGRWYQCHRIFREVLRFELARLSPELVAGLHSRAASWFEAAGELQEAVEHALAAGDTRTAADTLARRWRPLYQFGQYATLRRLLQELPRTTVDDTPPLGFIAAMLDGVAGGPESVIEARLARMEQVGWDGPFPDSTPSVAVAVAFVRTVYIFGDVRASLEAADSILEVAPDDYLLGAASRLTRARALYFMGDLDGASEALERFERGSPDKRPTMSVYAPALLALIELERGNTASAHVLAGEAVDLADELGMSDVPILSIAPTALGAALAARGELHEGRRQLERGVELSAGLGSNIPKAHALLALAPVRSAIGDRAGARRLLVEARAIIDQARDPGALAARLEGLERRLSTRSRREISPDDLPTESELRVLRLLSSGLTQREIGAELFLSANTVKSHTRALYRKLGAGSREEAVARGRSLGLI